MEAAGVWVPSLMGVVKALPQGLTGMLVSKAYSLLSALLLLGEASLLLGMGISNEIHAEIHAVKLARESALPTSIKERPTPGASSVRLSTLSSSRGVHQKTNR